MKVIYNAISKTLLCHDKDPEKLKFQLLRTTETSVVKIGGTTIRSGQGFTPGKSYLVSMTNIKLLSEIGYLRWNLCLDRFAVIHDGLQKYLCWFRKKNLLLFQLWPYLTCFKYIQSDYFQLFSQISDKDNMKNLLGLQFYHLFKYAELTEAVRGNYKLPITLLNKVRVDNIMM